MKKITILLVIIFTFLFSTTSWGDWNYVTETVKGNRFYYDKDRIRKRGKYLYFWELVDYIKPSAYGDLSTTTYVQLDCSIFRYKDLKVQFYNKSMGEGNITTDTTPKGKHGEWKYPTRNSSKEYMFEKICEEHQ